MSLAEKVLAPEECDCCRRRFFPEWSACKYCGWDPNAPAEKPSRTIPEETFRCGANLAAAGVLALTLGAVAILVGNVALNLHWTEDPTALWVTVGVCTLLGPFLFALQLRRRIRGPLLLREDGLELDGVMLPWPDIERVEFRGGLLRGESRHTVLANLHESLDGLLGILFYRIAVFISVLCMIYVACMSVIALVTPWHPRVIVQMVSGDKIVLRDVENGARLARTAMGYVDGPNAVS